MVHEQDNTIRNFMPHTLLLIGGRLFVVRDSTYLQEPTVKRP